jgi:hypothetical protein
MQVLIPVRSFRTVSQKWIRPLKNPKVKELEALFPKDWITDISPQIHGYYMVSLFDMTEEQIRWLAEAIRLARTQEID